MTRASNSDQNPPAGCETTESQERRGKGEESRFRDFPEEEKTVQTAMAGEKRINGKSAMNQRL